MTRAFLLSTVFLTALTTLHPTTVKADPPVPAGPVVNWSSPPDGLSVSSWTIYASGVWSSVGAPCPNTAYLAVHYKHNGTFLQEGGAYGATICVEFADDETQTYSGTWAAIIGIPTGVSSGDVVYSSATICRWDDDVVTGIGYSSEQTIGVP